MISARRFASALGVGLVSLGLAGGSLAACSSKPAAQKTINHKKDLRKRNEKAAKTARLLITPTAATESRSIVVREVVLPARSLTSGSSTSGGYVAVAPVSGGKPGSQVLGATRVKAGTTKNVRIPVSVALDPGSYFLLLFGGTTKPSTTTSGKVLAKTEFTLKK